MCRGTTICARTCGLAPLLPVGLAKRPGAHTPHWWVRCQCACCAWRRRSSCSSWRLVASFGSGSATGRRRRNTRGQSGLHCHLMLARCQLPLHSAALAGHGTYFACLQALQMITIRLHSADSCAITVPALPQILPPAKAASCLPAWDWPSEQHAALEGKHDCQSHTCDIGTVRASVLVVQQALVSRSYCPCMAHGACAAAFCSLQQSEGRPHGAA